MHEFVNDDYLLKVEIVCSKYNSVESHSTFSIYILVFFIDIYTSSQQRDNRMLDVKSQIQSISQKSSI